MTIFCKESLLSRLKRETLRIVLMYLASNDIPMHVLKELNIKKLLEHLRWTHWMWQQKEVQGWLEFIDWGDPEEIKRMTESTWDNFSKSSKEWIETIYTRQQK